MSTINLDTQTILTEFMAAGARAATPVQGTEAEPLLLVPPNYKVEPLAKYGPPRFPAAHPRMRTLRSFLEYVERFKQEGTAIFLRVDPPIYMVAALDYHSPDRLGRLAHYCSYEPQVHPMWEEWCNLSAMRFTQEELGHYLQERSKHIVYPSAAELLEAVLALQGSSNLVFGSEIPQGVGTTDVSVRQEQTLVSKRGQTPLPSHVQVALYICRGEPAVPAYARIQARIDNKSLTFQLLPDDPHDLLDCMVDRIAAEVEDITHIRPYRALVAPSGQPF
jgi:hypothetical protein